MTSDNNHSTNDAIELFEEAWQGTSLPDISLYLDPLLVGDVPSFNEAQEIIKIDLEYRWRKAPVSMRQVIRQEDRAEKSLQWCPQAQDYFDRFSKAFPSDPDRCELVVEEYRVRRRWGDDPPIRVVVDAYPDLAEAVIRDLQKVDQELASRKSFVDRKYAQTPDNLEKKSLDDVNVGDRLDDFQLLQLLGRGTFAKVFFAQQISMQRLVALKVSEQSSGESVFLAQLDHPNIVRVYDQTFSQGLHLIYMQFVDGGSLRESLDDRRYASASEDKESRVAGVGAQLAAALEHAHDKGILHRDIKPENVLLHADGRPCLADFNLSYTEPSSLVVGHQKFGGTLDFMSPEQLEVLQGQRSPSEVGATSDIYSLAIILHLLLNDKHPFVREGEFDESRIVHDRIELRRSVRERSDSQPQAGPASIDHQPMLSFR